MKTIDQLAKEYVQSRPYSTLDSPKLKEEAYDGFAEGVNHAEKWIPIKEFPEKQNEKYSQVVLVKDIDCDYFVCYYNYKLNRFVSDESGNTINNVTHWRHIHLNNKK